MAPVSTITTHSNLMKVVFFNSNVTKPALDILSEYGDRSLAPVTVLRIFL